jgi:hypothetical protein
MPLDAAESALPLNTDAERLLVDAADFGGVPRSGKDITSEDASAGQACLSPAIPPVTHDSVATVMKRRMLFVKQPPVANDADAINAIY